ncbi:MAG: alpha-isopropylmalate synthase regulatory domain-containing protein, partial [Actinomycetes bacterium]
GERAGNAALEEIVMLLHTRGEAYGGLFTNCVTEEIARTSRLVSRLTGYAVQPNKAVVGRNAFAHESGIHQDGVLKERTTYEIMDARTIGLDANSIVLGKHSGRHALGDALSQLGYKVDGEELRSAFKRFKEIADRKKQVTAMDLEALVTDSIRTDEDGLALESFEVSSASGSNPTASVRLRLADGTKAQATATGDGTFDSLFGAIASAAGHQPALREFRVEAVTAGEDALGETSVVVDLNGTTGAGQAVSTDVVEAAGKAYVRALSNAIRRSRSPETAGLEGTP